jgi:glycosyltransferase involved in cell wall biosynthesis
MGNALRIGVDLSITMVDQAGTSIYACSLADALKHLESGDKYRFFARNTAHGMVRRKTIRSRTVSIYRDIIWTHVVLPMQVRHADIEILHMPANVIPLFQPCPTVVTILDTTVFQKPEKFTLWHRNYYRLFIALAAKYAKAILTISEQSKRDIVSQLHVAPEKVSVTHLAASSRFRLVSERASSEIRRKYDLRTFILTIGTLEPRKNMVRLLQAFASLRQAGFCYQLIHAGPQGWLFEDVLAEVDRLGLHDSVRFLGRIPLEDLVRLYNAASVFVYPSLYEGFGIPVLEAMACGCPVITSNISSLPEVVGEAGMLVDPYNVQELTEALRQVLEDADLAHQLREKGLRRAGLFSWHRCAQQTQAIYHQVARL